MKRNMISMAAAWMVCAALSAQDMTTDPNAALMPGERPKPTKYIEVKEEKQHLVLFQGFTLSADVYGLAAYALSDYGWAEGALRLNLKNTYFPIVEAGYAMCEKEDYNTKISYKAKAPYARIGVDVNMLKNKFQDNRLYVGVRYGLSKYKYDMAGPAVDDPIWGGSEAFANNGIDCTSQWGELVFGVEVKMYRNFHMGWAVRYKKELSSTESDFAKPACIPGYGYTTNATCWSGTYSLIFDLNWGKKKNRKKGVSVTITDIAPENKAEKAEDQAEEVEKAEKAESQIEKTEKAESQIEKAEKAESQIEKAEKAENQIEKAENEGKEDIKEEK